MNKAADFCEREVPQLRPVRTKANGASRGPDPVARWLRRRRLAHAVPHLFGRGATDGIGRLLSRRMPAVPRTVLHNLGDDGLTMG